MNCKSIVKVMKDMINGVMSGDYNIMRSYGMNSNHITTVQELVNNISGSAASLQPHHEEAWRQW